MNKNQILLGIGAIFVVVFVYYLGSQSNNPSSKPSQTSQSIQDTTSQQVVKNTPQQVAQNSDDLQFKCAQLGATAKSTFETKYPDVSQTLLTDAVFHYNTRLHKCYFGREVHNRNQDGSGSAWKGITDLYSNKDVLYNIDFLSSNGTITGEFSAINYIGYPNEQGGGVIKSRVEFESLYNKTLTE